jgi:hypothetical protein
MGSDGRFELEEVNAKKDRWFLTLAEGRIRVERDDGREGHDIERSRYGTGFELRKLPGSRQVLFVRMPKGKAFHLEPAVADAIERWLRPFTRADVAAMLKARLKWTIPIAILFILTSMPLPGDAEQGIDPIPFDPIGCVLGVGLIVLAILARVAPHRNLFLVDAVWFVMLAADTAWSVVAEGSSPLWLLLSLFLVWAAAAPLALYRRFESTE